MSINFFIVVYCKAVQMDVYQNVFCVYVVENFLIVVFFSS